jgi:tryptophan synthase alpha chain
MTYAPILEAYGRDRFAADARAAGAESLIVADLPVGAWPEVRRVHLVAPTTSAERIRAAGETTDGWLYLVSVTGITGPRTGLPPELPALARRAREAAAVPLVAGFGISTPEQAEGVAALVDGIVVGSAALLAAEAEGPAGVGSLVAALRRAVDRVATVGSRP